jgi:hypothetical protein
LSKLFFCGVRLANAIVQCIGTHEKVKKDVSIQAKNIFKFKEHL